MLEFNLYQLMILLLAVSIIKEMLLVVIFKLDSEIFDPIINYRRWRKINWFGVIMGTIFLHIIFPVLAIFYWGYRLVTTGRK